MKKYKLQKPHNGLSAGDEIEVSKEQETYFKSVGLIKEEKPKHSTKEEKKAFKTK